MKGHGWLAIALGGTGTVIMLAAYLPDAIQAWLAHGHPTSVAVSDSVSASAAPQPAPTGLIEEKQGAIRAQAAATVVAATNLVRDKAKLEASMASAGNALAAKQFGAARRAFDGLWSALGSVNPIDLVPNAEADPPARPVLL